jgi:hypothetical protein
MVIKHNTSNANTNSSPENHMQYNCELCHYNTLNKKDYNKHLLTQKHIILTTSDPTTEQQHHTYTCDCGKIYKHRQSLHNHGIKCTYDTSVEESNESTVNTVINDSATIAELLRQNQEFKQLMIDQNKQIQETQSQLQKSFAQNTELQNQIIEWFKEGKASK